jgi:hypothetical protein
VNAAEALWLMTPHAADGPLLTLVTFLNPT